MVQIEKHWSEEYLQTLVFKSRDTNQMIGAKAKHRKQVVQIQALTSFHLDKERSANEES
jgi:hypothetical protein